MASMQINAARMAFVHGWGFGPEIWRSTLPSFADPHPVCWHLPGYAHIDSRPLPDANAATDDSDTWIGIGWSLGGQHLLQLANRQPQNFQALVLVATNAQFAHTEQWPHGIASEQIHQWGNRVAVNAKNALRRFARLCVQGAANAENTYVQLENCLQRQSLPSLATLQFGLQSLAQSNLIAELGQLKTPTLLIGGDTDHLVPAAALQAMKESNPAIELEIIAGAGHAPFLSHAEFFHQRVLRFLT